MRMSARSLSKTALLSVCLLSVLLASSCSQRKVPDPPRLRPELLLDIFTSMGREDHKAALNKILRLKEVDKTSIFLAELENLERNNMYLVEARGILEKGDIDGALEVLSGALKRLGAHETLAKAHAELLTLKEMSSLIDTINSPKSSAQLKESSARLGAIAESYPPAARFKPFVEAACRRAAQLELFERGRALFDLSSDADILFQAGSPEAGCLVSQLAVECPKHPALKRYLSRIALSPGPRKAPSSSR